MEIFQGPIRPIPQTRSMRENNKTGYSPFNNLRGDRFQSITRSAPMSSVRFGSCMCPICLSIGIIENAYNNIDKIKQGETVETGSLMRNISAQTNYDYMSHENATRLVVPAQADDNRIRAAVLDRVKTQNGHQVKLEVPPEGGLFTTVFSAFAKAPHKPQSYKSYPKAMDTLPVNDVSLPDNPQQATLLTILHQMYPENNNPQTTPVSMGYVLTQKVIPDSKEMVVLSTREFPTMENMDVVPAGVANMLGLMAFGHYGNNNSLAVVAESQQSDLEGYMKHLKSLGIPIKTYASPAEHATHPAETLPMPPAYQEEIRRMHPQQAPTIYQIDIQPLKEWIRTGVPQATRRALLKADPGIEEKLPKPQQKGLSDQALLTILRNPPRPGAKVFQEHQHDHGGEGCKLPELTYQEKEQYKLNLQDP